MNSLLPVVSVVTVVRNAAAVIEATIESILSQDYPAIEYIVIDGLSTDGTLDIVQRYRDSITALRSERDNGIYDAMNKAAALATGEWIIFMNAGDTFHGPNALSRLAPQLASDADVLCGGAEQVLVDEIGTRSFHIAPGNPSNLWRHMPTSHQATLVRRGLQQQYRFDTSYRWCADHDLLARLYGDGRKFALVDEVICVFDCAGGMARDPRIYIRERWRLSRRLASLPRRFMQYAGEWLHCIVWGRAVTCLKAIVPAATLRKIRQLRGTAGRSDVILTISHVAPRLLTRNASGGQQKDKPE